MEALPHREGDSQRQQVVVLDYYPSWEPHRPTVVATNAAWPVHALTRLRQGAPIIADLNGSYAPRCRRAMVCRTSAIGLSACSPVK